MVVARPWYRRAGVPTLETAGKRGIGSAATGTAKTDYYLNYQAARTPARAPTEPPWKEPPRPALTDQVRSIL